MDTNIIPFGRYCIDSSKFYIDRDKFEVVNIPQNFLLTDSETGEFIDEFKKNSLPLSYKNHKIYISNVVKTLGREDQKFMVDRVMIYFPSKISDNYFGGLIKEDIIGVLEFLRQKGYLIFSDIEKIYDEIYVKDVDIKMDMKLKILQRDEIDEYFGVLKERFNDIDDNCTKFKSQKQGFGLQCWKRETSKVTKPFFKFYDKSKEIKKDIDFFNSLPNNIREEVVSNFILRYEFTMKDNRFFKKYGLSNRLRDVFEISQDKWKEVGRQFISYAFDRKIRNVDTSKLKLKDRVQINLINLMLEKGITKNQVFTIYTKSAQNRNEKNRAKKDFDRIWSLAVTPSEYTKEMLALVGRVKKWDGYFGLS